MEALPTGAVPAIVGGALAVAVVLVAVLARRRFAAALGRAHWRIVAPVLVVLFMVLLLGWYQQRIILCQDALQRRRTTLTDRLAMALDSESAENDVQRYCFTWVGR